MGNRLSKQDSATGSTSYAYNAANMLLSSSGSGASNYSNDADGNTLTGGGRTNTWDSQNRMVSCITGSNNNTFKYGADGLRRQKTTNGVSTDYSYDSTMMVREGHASNGTFTPTITYLNGARGPEYRRDDTQTEIDSQGRTVTKTRWYVYDGLGSVVGELDPLGNLTSSPKYDVYGNVRSNGGTASTKHGFVGSLGHLSEAETGLIYMRARYMDPAIGRFISEDPECDGPNWFVYCSDNPGNAKDPSGEFTLIDVILGDTDDTDAIQATEARMASEFGDWASNKIMDAIGKWAKQFADQWSEDLIYEFNNGDVSAWYENDNLKIAGEDGNWLFRLDFNDGDPHFNLDINGGSAADSMGNHAPIQPYL